MEKEKLIGIKDDDDSVWFKVAATDKSAEYLDKIYEFSHMLYEPDEKNKYSYKRIISFGDVSFLEDEPEHLAYFIFTPNLIHVILRKERNYETKKKKMLEYFEFKRSNKA